VRALGGVHSLTLPGEESEEEFLMDNWAWDEGEAELGPTVSTGLTRITFRFSMSTIPSPTRTSVYVYPYRSFPVHVSTSLSRSNVPSPSLNLNRRGLVTVLMLTPLHPVRQREQAK